MNFIAWFSILAIVMGTAALILVLSVFNGFEGLVKSLYSSFYTDLKILPASGKTLTLSQAQLQQIKGIRDIKNFSLVVEEKAMLQNGDYQSVIDLKGVDDNYRYVTGVEDHLRDDAKYNVGTEDDPMLILGSGVEAALGVQANKNIFYLQIYLPRKNKTEQLDPLNDITSDSIGTSSAFVIQQDFDNRYAITNLDFVKRALRLDSDQYSGAEIALLDPSKASDVQARLKKVLGTNYLVQTRYQQNQSLYSIMNLERWIIYGVLCLVLVVASFTMIGALTMLVLEKRKDVNVLHSLGATRSFIQKVFLSEGLLLGIIGTVLGMLLALLIGYLQIKYHLIKLEGGSFLIDYFPVQLKLTDFLLVGATVFVIALLASWIPSRKAARQEFSLRSE